MELYTVRKTVNVCCAHRLPGHPTCDKLHGHNFKITMEVSAGALMPPYFFVVDFGELKFLAKRFDHSGDVHEVSAELMAAHLGREIRGAVQDNTSLKGVVVTVEETPGSVAEWRWERDDDAPPF